MMIGVASSAASGETSSPTSSATGSPTSSATGSDSGTDSGTETVRVNHVTVTASDFATSLAFYDAALCALGMTRVAEFGDEEEDDPALEAAAWAAADGAPVLWLVAGGPPTSGVHVSFRAPSRASVEAFFHAAIGAGGKVHDAPRRWAIYRAGEFNALVSDPDDNLVEAVASE